MTLNFQLELNQQNFKKKSINKNQIGCNFKVRVKGLLCHTAKS